MEKNNKGWEIDMLPINESKQSGDCILLRFGDLYSGKDKQNVFIIDGGFSDTAKSIKEHLKRYYDCFYDGKYHITGMVLSHTDKDHISGLVKLLEDDEIQLSNLIVNIPWLTMNRTWFKDGRITNDSLRKELKDVFDKLLSLVTLAKDKHKATFWYGVDNIGQELIWGDAKFTILGPDKIFYNTCIANSEKTREMSDKVETLDTTSIISLEKEEKYVPNKIEWPENDSTSPINESSIVFLFEYEGVKILFTGDSGRLGLANALQHAEEHTVDLSDVLIIKMPHHGSRHNIEPSFLDVFTKPNRTCYISCVSGDEGHHPSKRLVNLLNEKGFRVITTSGSTVHRSKNAPNRNWDTAITVGCYPTMEKLNV